MIESSSTKKKLFFIGYNISVVIVFIALLELILRYFLYHPGSIPNFLREPYRKYYSLIVRSTIQMEPQCAQYDEKLFYTLKPGSCTFSNMEFSNSFNINSLGTRDTESALQQPEIVFVGDSFTMGWGVPKDSCFVGRIKHIKNKKILNAGISSYGTVRELKLLERIQRDSLKTLVIQYHSSDIGENKEFFESHNQLKISSHADYDKYSKNVRERSKYFFTKHTAYIGKFLIKSIVKPEKSITNNSEVKYFLNALIHAPVSLQGINIVVLETFSYNKKDNFLGQLRHEIENNIYPDYIKSIKIINLEEILSDADYYILDDHLKPSGHKKIADKLSQIL